MARRILSTLLRLFIYLLFLSPLAASWGGVHALSSRYRLGMPTRAVLYVACTVAFIAVVSVIANVIQRRRERVLIKERQGYAREDFVAELAGRNVPENISQAAFDYFQGTWTLTKTMPVKPDDNISDVFGLVDEDLEDAILDVAELAGCRKPEKEDFHTYPTPVNTLGDLAVFLSTLD